MPIERAPGRATGLHSVSAVLLPTLACLVCPICLRAELGLLAALGLGVFVSEGVHRALVSVSLLVALISAAVVARRHRRRGPIMVTIAGAMAVVAGCIISETPALEYSGFALVVAAAIWNWRLARRAKPALFRIQTGTHVRLP